MKTTHFTPAVWLGIAALTTSVWAQPPAPAGGNAPAAGTPPARGARAPGTLIFNFRGAPLETVLNYMSEEAGFTIVLETPVRGTVDMFSAQPVTREEAIQLLNYALNKNGFTSIVQGRMILISSKEEAKKKNLPIRTSDNPDEIPNTAEMYIQIIPLRRLDAATAARDLGTLLPGTSTLTANADSNSLVVTDTNINLKQVVALVRALDTSSDSVSAMEIFKLKNADPFEMAQLLTNVFGGTAQGANGRGGQVAGGNAFAQALGGFGGDLGGGGGRGGGGGGNAAGRGGRGATGGARSVPVVAVADPRTLSVIVTASKDQMPDIAQMVTQLDAASGRKQEAYVYTMENGNVKQAEAILRNLFPSSRAGATTNQQVDPLQARATANAQSAATTSQSIQLGTGTTTTTTGTAAR